MYSSPHVAALRVTRLTSPAATVETPPGDVRPDAPPKRSGTPPLELSRAAQLSVAERVADQVATAGQTATAVGPSAEPACQEQDLLLSEATPQPSAQKSGAKVNRSVSLRDQTRWSEDPKPTTKAEGTRGGSARRWKDHYDADAEREQLDRAMKLFDELDRDYSGHLDKDELAQLARKLHHRWSEVELGKHWERLASMEREYRRFAHDSSGLDVGFVPDISAPVSRDLLGVAGGNGSASPHSYAAPWYVFVPRLTKLSAIAAQQRLRRDYERVDLNTLKGQAEIWGVDGQILAELTTKHAVTDLMATMHATKQLFDISFLKPFSKERPPSDRQRSASSNDRVALTTREAGLIWARYYNGFDPNERSVSTVQQPVFLVWWKSYRRRMQREMLIWAQKRFKKHSHVTHYTETSECHVRDTFSIKQVIRIMSPDEMIRLGSLVNKRFPWVEADMGSKVDVDAFHEARECQSCIVEGALTFGEFAYYLKKKIGNDEALTPILPEFMIQSINDNIASKKTFSHAAGIAHQSIQARLRQEKSYRTLQSAKAGLQEARAKSKEQNTAENRTEVARALWRFLRPRLEMLVRLETVWGSVHDLYPQKTESIYLEDFVPRFIRHPDSRLSVGWDLFQVFALVYVAALVPLRICFSYEPRPPTVNNGGEFEWWTDLLIDLYFITDIVIQFHTAFVEPTTGKLITDRHEISRSYLRSWFLVDLMSVLPLHYILLLMGGKNNGMTPLLSRLRVAESGNETKHVPNFDTKILKLVRFLRIAKLLRLTKFKGMLVRYEDKFDVIQYIHITATLVISATAIHFIGCLWYAIGTGEGSNGLGQFDSGWVLNSRTGLQWERGWIPLRTRYSTAIWSAFSGQWAFTDSEKIFSMVAQLVSGLIYAALAGVMSSIMMSSKAAEQEKTLKFASIRAWMKSRGLARTTQAQILSHYNSKYKLRAIFDEEQVKCFAMQQLRHQLTQSLN